MCCPARCMRGSPLKIWSLSLCGSLMARAVWSSNTMLSSAAGDLTSNALRFGWNLPLRNSEVAEFDRLGAPFLIGEGHTSPAR